MSDLNIWLKIVLAILATWRLTHLLAFEDGPGDIIVKLRIKFGNSFWGKLMDCFNCLSIWIAAPVTVLVTLNIWNVLLVWPAVSGAACLLNKLIREPVYVQNITPETENHLTQNNTDNGNEKNGLLWTEKNDNDEHSPAATTKL